MGLKYNPVWASGRFSTAGATVSAQECSAARTGAGRYTVTLDTNIETAQCCGIQAQSHTTGVIAHAAIPTFGATTTTIAVETNTDAGVATDAAFSITVLSSK